MDFFLLSFFPDLLGEFAYSVLIGIKRKGKVHALRV
jgi:hypothetical protein